MGSLRPLFSSFLHFPQTKFGSNMAMFMGSYCWPIGSNLGQRVLWWLFRGWGFLFSELPSLSLHFTALFSLSVWCHYIFPCWDADNWECVTPFCLCFVALHCLSVLGIVFLPNAALYWLCEFLSRNRPNSGKEFRSLREIMGQSEEIYGAHI